MHIRTQSQINSVLSLLTQVQSKLIGIEDNQYRNQILMDCQNAAIAIGETLENYHDEYLDVIHALEQYCESVYKFSRSERTETEDILQLQDAVSDIRLLVSQKRVQFRVVFFPYKAEMWDSLESIWRAFAIDDKFECAVVPIPYGQYNEKQDCWEDQYEGARFPSGVPITDYREYDLQIMRPDIAFIHNPYDEYNLVTRVASDYFSHELKKTVGTLVYVPYFASAGRVSLAQRELSVHRSMDYMIIQSEKVKQCYKGYYYYDRILPLGSPKFDKVIQKCQRGVAISDEWKEMLDGRRCLMLNTTINDLLRLGKILLQKHLFFFGLIKSEPRVTVIWRPHPLLEATIQAMRPELLEMYNDIVEYFKRNRIGVIDKTPDLTDTIAIADGYVGAVGSSVINSFSVSGKPMFLFDDLTLKLTDEHLRKRVSVCSAVAEGNKVWMISAAFNGLLSIDLNLKDKSVYLEEIIKEESRWRFPYVSIGKRGRKIYMAANIVKRSVAFDMDKKEYSFVKNSDKECSHHFVKTLIGKEEIVMFLYESSDICFLNRKSGILSRDREALPAMWKGTAHYTNMEWFRDAVLEEDVLWVVSEHTNNVMRYSLSNGKFRIYQIEKDNIGISCIAVCKDAVWLADAKDGSVYKWNYSNGSIAKYAAPANYRVRSDYLGFKKAQLNLFDMEEWIVSVPAFSNMAYRLNKRTGKSEPLVLSLWEDAEIACSGYAPHLLGTCSFALQLDAKRILLQRNMDWVMAIVNVEENSCELFYPELDQKSYERLREGQDGFERAGSEYQFCCYESHIFPLEDFIRKFADGEYADMKERQLEAISDMAANLDGTCGQKVHDYLEERLF